jgi:hypothetical protein
MREPSAKQRQMIDIDEFERRLGRPSAPIKSGEDPLAELARLVGETEDRFKTVFQPRAAMPTPAYAEPRYNADQPVLGGATRTPRLGGDFAAIEAGLRSCIAPESRAVPAPDPEWEAEDWLDAPYAAPVQTHIEPPRSRLPLYATAAIILLGMAGIGGSFALKRHAIAPREIATIEAAAGPTKIPASDTTDAPPNQDASILDKSPQPAPVAVVDHSEEPVNLGGTQQGADQGTAPKAAPSQMQVASAAPGDAAVVPVPQPPALDTQAQSFGLSGMIEPKKVKTVVVRPDGTIVGEDAPQQQAEPQQQTQQQAFPPISPVIPPAAPNDSAPTTDNTPTATTTAHVSTPSSDTAASPDNGAANIPNTQLAEAKPVKIAKADADTTDAAPADSPKVAGTFAVQLAAPQTEAAARQSMAKLQRQFGSELAGHRLKYHQATVADKSVYRVRVVGLSHEGATTLCQKLQAKGGACFVIKD